MEQENDSSSFSPTIDSKKNPFFFVEHRGTKQVIATSGYEVRIQDNDTTIFTNSFTSELPSVQCCGLRG